MTATITRLDQPTLTELVRPGGPVASVYFGPWPAPGADPDVEWRARIQALTRHLRRDGADPSTVEAVESPGWGSLTMINRRFDHR